MFDFVWNRPPAPTPSPISLLHTQIWLLTLQFYWRNNKKLVWKTIYSSNIIVHKRILSQCFIFFINWGLQRALHMFFWGFRRWKFGKLAQNGVSGWTRKSGEILLHDTGFFTISWHPISRSDTSKTGAWKQGARPIENNLETLLFVLVT